jgi:methyltransferase-like protein
VIVTGNPDEMKVRIPLPRPLRARADGARAQFVGYYVKDGRVIAVSSMQNDPLAIKASELFRLGRFPSADAIRAGTNILEIDISSTKAGNTA